MRSNEAIGPWAIRFCTDICINIGDPIGFPVNNQFACVRALERGFNPRSHRETRGSAHYFPLACPLFIAQTGALFGLELTRPGLNPVCCSQRYPHPGYAQNYAFWSPNWRSAPVDRSGDIAERVRVWERKLRSYSDAWREHDKLHQAVGATRCIADSGGSDRSRALDYPNDACAH